MKTALFTNFTDYEFIGYWDGKAKKFAPHESLYMPDYLAKHFAKHLTNRELLRTDVNGNPVHKNGEKFTSPKFPEQVPIFMELFNKAYTPNMEDEENMSSQKDDVETQIEVANKNRKPRAEEKQSPDEAQIVLPPSDDDEDEEEFGGKPNDPETKK